MIHVIFSLRKELYRIPQLLSYMATSSRFRTFLWLATAALVGPLAAAAQQAPATAPVAPAATNASRVLVYKAAPPEQRADKMSQEITRQLNLDAATTVKVRAAALTRDQKIDAIQSGTTSSKDKNTALQANAQEFKAALQGILTPAQYAQYMTHGGKSHGGKTTGKPRIAPTPAN